MLGEQHVCTGVNNVNLHESNFPYLDSGLNHSETSVIPFQTVASGRKKWSHRPLLARLLPDLKGRSRPKVDLTGF